MSQVSCICDKSSVQCKQNKFLSHELNISAWYFVKTQTLYKLKITSFVQSTNTFFELIVRVRYVASR